ncbi:regulatory protein RecX [Desulfatitalea alkaliphila]|uniref:Regulatory protein RecX n=1 Tax=Desulfatitalea alkaliphila TaxID=2929485 RepID=A0AA41UIM7_9BACT|nr:regulatory protein RecX [Desulfatitalea alkaliphila]MCJ8500940.1 recombination regulator RecX [Desulfatitalea alkaliphila]
MGDHSAPSVVTACRNTALRLLGRREHSVAELRRKLQERGFDTDTIADVLADCRRLGYLDDDRFAHLYSEQLRRRGYGRLRIEQMLKSKGLSAACVAVCVTACCAEAGQIEDCRRVLRKKLQTVSGEATAPRTAERLYRFLMQRGFAAALIRQVLDELRWPTGGH